MKNILWGPLIWVVHLLLRLTVLTSDYTLLSTVERCQRQLSECSVGPDTPRFIWSSAHLNAAPYPGLNFFLRALPHEDTDDL